MLQLIGLAVVIYFVFRILDSYWTSKNQNH